MASIKAHLAATMSWRVHLHPDCCQSHKDAQVWELHTVRLDSAVQGIPGILSLCRSAGHMSLTLCFNAAANTVGSYLMQNSYH